MIKSLPSELHRGEALRSTHFPLHQQTSKRFLPEFGRISDGKIWTKTCRRYDRMSCTWPYSRIAKTSHNKNERVPRNPRGKRRKSSEISAMERQWLLSFPELNIVIDRRRECRHSCASNCHLSSPCPRANLRSRRRRHGRASDATRINSIPNIVLRSNLLDRALRPRVDHPESRETPGVAAHGLGSGSEPYAQLLPGRALEINGFINSVRVASEEEAEENSQSSTGHCAQSRLENA
mmetsp:Transcript_649/g.1453  ORF Transcript_649/g.1453 Transcript_649/m.1453 type:complete len:236 (+) Transcript_649:524-1231(+)